MTTPPILPDGEEKEPRDAAYWAQLTSLLQVSRVPTGALNLNVEGRQVVGPLQGFGQMWKKTYTLRLPEISMMPAEVMEIWKANFARFQPRQNRFFPVMKTIEPGDIVLINASMTGMPLSTGVMVLYADDESFTLMTPQGHPESGWVTFSVSTDDDGLFCQVQSIARANDPVYEIGFRTFGSRTQERIWIHVMETLAAHLQAPGQVQVDKTCVDPRVQWSEARNIWQNAALRTMIYTLGTPLRWLRRGRARHQR
ncbi:MAG: DUF1990 family protein [Chloroflexota bacterium]|nr:DUF1990 family protein [Chloroflexota bacterium]